MSKHQRTRRLRRRQAAARRRLTRTAAVAFTGSLIATALPAGAAPPLDPGALTPTAAAAPRPLDPVALVRDVRPGPRGANVAELLTLGDQLLVSQYDEQHGQELWRTDGSEAGTVLVADLDPRRTPSGRALGSDPDDFTAVDGGVVFSAVAGARGRELWRTDGTAAGTTRITDVPGGVTEFSPGLEIDDRLGDTVVVAGGAVYFVVDDGVHGSELWRTDDSPAGASLVADLDPRPGEGSEPHQLTALGDRVVFTAEDPEVGRELWVSDGTAAGTTLLADVRRGTHPDFGPFSSYPTELTTVGGTVYLVATDNAHGRELWSTDGTRAGTGLVADLRTGRPDDANPGGLTVAGDTLFFLASADDRGVGLWRTGEDGEPRWVKDLDTGGSFSYLCGEPVAADGVVYFSAADRAHGDELWRTDGTAAGTRLVEDLLPGAASSSPCGFTVAGDVVYLNASDRRGDVLWRTDGTAAGTSEVARDVTDEPTEQYYYHPVQAAVGDDLFFVADDGVHGRELWSTADAAAAVPRLDNTAVPRIRGVRDAGRVLVADPGRWSPSAGLRFTYQWYLYGEALRGATGPRYRVRPGREADPLTVRVVASKPGWRGRVAYSTITAAGPLVVLQPPSALGERRVGARLTATTGQWSARGLRFAFQWRIAGAPVRGADGRSFRLPPRAAGKGVSLRVTAQRPGRPASAASYTTYPQRVFP